MTNTEELNSAIVQVFLRALVDCTHETEVDRIPHEQCALIGRGAFAEMSRPALAALYDIVVDVSLGDDRLPAARAMLEKTLVAMPLTLEMVQADHHAIVPETFVDDKGRTYSLVWTSDDIYKSVLECCVPCQHDIGTMWLRDWSAVAWPIVAVDEKTA